MTNKIRISYKNKLKNNQQGRVNTVRVFISYDFRDRPWVENFVQRLKQNANSSLDLKIADRSVQYGDNFLNWMDTCLKTADIFMPIISSNYVQNISFARLEYQEMILRSNRSQKRIIPVFMEKVDIEDLPIGISSIRSFYAYVEDYPLAELIPSITSNPDPNFTKRLEFIPTDRRIRVQVTSACNQNCDWCHNDEFEKNQTNAPPKEIIDNLIKHFGSFHGTPRPRLEFAFTGGEPLTDPDLFFDLIQDIPSDILENSFLLTNGRELNDKTQSRLKELGLLNIRITFSNLEEEPFCHRIQPSDGAIDHFNHIVKNIRRISRDSKFKIRINHTLITDNQEEEIRETLLYVNEHFPGIRHIAFIQMDQSNRDIFEIGKKWADGEDASLNKQTISPRINQYKWSGGVTVDFIKMNCHLVEKNRQRCLLCVIDKDISITSGGRIRLCYEKRKDDKCTYQDLHLDDHNPWKGISAAIRTQWATAGFYRHFEDLVTKEEINVIPDFHLNRYGARIQKALKSQNLYEEKFNDQKEAIEVIELCGRFLDRAFEQFQKKDKTKKEKLVANINLLILIYLCVDETLFSTGRTSMVQGIAFLILSKLNDNDNFQKIMKNDDWLSQLLPVTTYCIATIAMEKCSANIVKDYILNFSTEEEIGESCMLSYILGCIERQQGNDTKAISLFEDAHERSGLLIREPAFFDFLKPLLQEIHVESLRSKGVVYENSDRKKRKEYLQKAAFQSRIYNTKLQHTVTYSIGYYKMKSYFEKNPDLHRKVAFDAHRAFSESLRQNSDFFPGLIRMGLLETGLKYYDLAAERAKKARSVLKKKGLLTDLEYLNYWLNEMILKALKILKVRDINVTLQNYPVEGVTHCINAGMKDIICVHRDAKFLQKILRSKRIKLRELPQFLEDCQTLIRTKKSEAKGRIEY
jgi:sulfatase maturation enzyme AslB (radical SAM superfamily)